MRDPKHSKSFEIALCALSAAFASLFLAMGIISRFLLASGYLFAVVALMVPLSKRFVVGEVLAYLATLLVALLIGALMRFWELVPFAMFFGLHPLINFLQQKHRINRWLAYVVKAIWFDATLWVYVLLIGGTIGTLDWPIFEVINKYLWVFILVGGTVVFYVYDYFIFKLQIAVNTLVARIRK